MTLLSCVRSQKGSYRITLLGVLTDLPTSQTRSTMISISVVSKMQNTFGTAQQQFPSPIVGGTSRQFISFIELGPHGGESLSNQYMIQCFSGWGQLWIATVSQLLDAFLHSWSVFSSSRMLNRALEGYLPWFRHLQQGWYVKMLVCRLLRLDINLRCNLCTMEATVIRFISASEPLISSL